VPIRVELRSERGEVVRGLSDPAGGTFDAVDLDRVLPQVAEPPTSPPFRLLCYVDPYGNTVFNQWQMVDLLMDIERVAGHDLKPGERRGFELLRVMAERCRDSVHLYLWFIGD